MRTLTSLLATAALVGGVTIASAQSGSPTAPSGPTAGGARPPTATQQGVRGNRGTTGQAKGAGASPTQGSGSPTAPSGPGAGVLARRDVDSPSRIAVHERGRRGALVQLRTVVWTGDTRDTRPVSDISRALGLGL